jgi:hypothetical protein
MVDNLPPSSADVTEYGSLNLSETSGPHRPVMGLLYFTFTRFERYLLILRRCYTSGTWYIDVVFPHPETNPHLQPHTTVTNPTFV